MTKAHIKIINTSDGKKRVLVDEKIEVIIKNNTYYFSINEFSQEIKVNKDKIKIIRPEMNIDLQLNKSLKSVYKHQDNKLEMNFMLNSLEQKENNLKFNYSLVDNLEKEINNIDVEIKF